MPDARTVGRAVRQYQPGTRWPFGVLDCRDLGWRD